MLARHRMTAAAWSLTSIFLRAGFATIIISIPMAVTSMVTVTTMRKLFRQTRKVFSLAASTTMPMRSTFLSLFKQRGERLLRTLLT
jgi:hypothetical protein